MTELNKEIDPIPFELPVRSAAPEPLIANKLLVGRAVIRYHGLMPIPEGKDIQNSFDSQLDKDSQPERKAIQRLYSATLETGLRDKRLEIRTRRASAAPSDPGTFETAQLTIQ